MKIAIISEFDEDFRLLVITNVAIEHSKKFLNLDFQNEWISTEHIETTYLVFNL